MTGWLLAALIARAAPADAPTFEARGVATAEMEPGLEQAFLAVLLSEEELAGPLAIVGEPIPRPSRSLLEQVAPSTLGLDASPAEKAEFLLAVSALAPSAALAPKAAGRLGDRFYTAGRQALWQAREGRGEGAPLETAAVEAWMARALPLYRRAEEGTAKHPDRLAVRLAWAARLGGGGREDLDAAAALLEGAPATPWAAEARLVLAESWLRPDASWRLGEALEALSALSEDPRNPYPLYSRYLAAWTRFYAGEHGPAIDAMKRVVASEQGHPASSEPDLMSPALRDLVVFFAAAGESPFLDHPPPYRNVRPLYLRMLSDYAEQGKADQAIQMARRILAEGEPLAALLPPLIAALGTYDASPRLDVMEGLVFPRLADLQALPGPEGASARAALASLAAEAGAELHYSRIDRLDPLLLRRLSAAYTFSLALDPDGPKAAAVAALLSALEAPR